MQLDKTPFKSGLLQFLNTYSNNTQLVIPVYQRNYTWSKKDQIKTFLSDIENVLNGNFKHHFMGIVIYNLTKYSPINGNEFSIIDGQQRITTTIIMLYAIRDLLEEMGNSNSAQKIEDLYLENRNLNVEMKLKLKPFVSDDSALKKIVERRIEDFDKIDEKSNVYQNYKCIKEWLDDVLNEYTIDDILTALNQLYIIAVPIDNDDYPQKIFESINSKGVPLDSSDLIRNYIFMGLDNKTQEEYYEIYWKEIEKNISSESKKLEEFLRFYITSFSYSLPSTSNDGVYYAFKSLLENEYANDVNNVVNVRKTLESILRYSKYYNTIYYKDVDSITNDIRDAIKEFKRIDSKMPAPLLLKLFDYHSKNNEYSEQKISSKDLSSMILTINNYLMRRALANLDTSDITRIFAPLTRDVINEAKQIGFTHIVEILKKHLINKNQGKGAECPDNNKLKERIMANSNMYILKATRILLDKVELEGNSAPVDLSKLSVEHLMPQTPTQEWLNFLKCSDEEYSNYIHRLGNLTLASKSDNSKMSNNPFNYKKDILTSTNHLNLNKEILAKEGWSFADIEKRTEDLVNKANQLYPYETVANTYLKKNHIYLNTDDIIAEAIYDEDTHSVEILPGSMVKKDEIPYGVNSQNARLLELLEENILVEEDGNYVFKKDYTFYPQNNDSTALSSSAGFILHGSRNGWEYWKTKEGVKLCDFYKQNLKNDNSTQQDLIDKYWNEINSLIISNGRKYQVREDYHGKYFNFNVRKPYHGFIDFWEIKSNIIKFGLWFDDKMRCPEHIKSDVSIFNTDVFEYEYNEGNRAAYICVRRELPAVSDEDKFKELTKTIYIEIDRILVMCLKLS